MSFTKIVPPLLIGLVVGLLLGLGIGRWSKAQPTPLSVQAHNKSKKHQLPDISELQNDTCQVSAQETTPDAWENLCQKGEVLLKKACKANSFEACNALTEHWPGNSEEERVASATIFNLCSNEHHIDACKWVVNSTIHNTQNKTTARTILSNACTTQNNLNACRWIFRHPHNDPEKKSALKIILTLCTTQHNVDACDWIYSDENTEREEKILILATNTILDLCNTQSNIDACAWVMSTSSMDMGDNTADIVSRACFTNHHLDACDAEFYYVANVPDGKEAKLVLTEILHLCTTEHNIKACELMLNYSFIDKAMKQTALHSLEIMCNVQNNVSACNSVAQLLYLKVCE